MRSTVQHEEKTVPVKAAFAMTANKSLGQTLMKLGISLPTNVFSHGQMYVAQSRVGNNDKMKLLATIEKMTAMNICYSQIVAYHEILHD